MALIDFASRSERISVSGDGRDVIIIRDHYAYDVKDGFRERNIPPKPDEGYSTQVINFFSWSEDVSGWDKATLPRDAKVDQIRLDGNRCHLEIRRTTTGQIFKFEDSARSIRSLSDISLSVDPHEDDKIWIALEKRATEQRQAPDGQDRGV